MSIIHGKILTDEQAKRYRALWDEWMGKIDEIPARKEPIGNRLDSSDSPFKALEKKYKPLLVEILESAPDAPPAGA